MWDRLTVAVPAGSYIFVCMWKSVTKKKTLLRKLVILLVYTISSLFMSVIYTSHLSFLFFLIPSSLTYWHYLFPVHVLSLGLFFRRLSDHLRQVKEGFQFCSFCKNDMLIVWCHLFWILASCNLFMMSFRREHNWCNLQGCVNSSVLCVITFVQATMTQWHWNCRVGDGKGDDGGNGESHFMYCVLIPCTVL